MWCTVEDGQKPRPLQQIPVQVQQILDTNALLKQQNLQGMTLRRVLSSQGLNIFYFGRRDIDLFQYTDNDGNDTHFLKIKHPERWNTNEGDIYADNHKCLTFTSTGPNHVVLITDFENPREKGKQRYLILETGRSDRELFFTITGKPSCRSPKL